MFYINDNVPCLPQFLFTSHVVILGKVKYHPALRKAVMAVIFPSNNKNTAEVSHEVTYVSMVCNPAVRLPCHKQLKRGNHALGCCKRKGPH